MSSKARAVARTLARGVAEPRLTLLALRERGLRFVFDKLVRSSPEKLDSMVHGLAVRSAPQTLEDLQRLYGDSLAEVREEEPERYRVRLASGPTFVIRKEVCVADMRVVAETFISGDYREHPPLAGRTVLDVGANLGDTSVYYALQGARVIAYEPAKELFDLAVRNGELNGLEIKFNNLGIGCEDCMLEMAIGSRGANMLSTTIFPGCTAPQDLQSRMAIHVVPLAEVLARIGPVFLLKMDCEGCEYPALLSLSSDQLRTIDHIFVEYHASPEPLRRKLEDSGFAVRSREWKLLLADRMR